MKKLYYLIILTVILSLVLTGCFLSNVGQVPTSEKKPNEGGPFPPGTLVAGKNIDVGTVNVWNDADNLYVEYFITDPEWCLIETHLAVTTGPNNIPQKNGNPIPGKFPYQCCYDETEGEWLFVTKPEDLDAECSAEGSTETCLTAITYTIPLSEIDEGVEPEDLLYIAAHAVVKDMSCYQTAILYGIERYTGTVYGVDVITGISWVEFDIVPPPPTTSVGPNGLAYDVENGRFYYYSYQETPTNKLYFWDSAQYLAGSLIGDTTAASFYDGKYYYIAGPPASDDLYVVEFDPDGTIASGFPVKVDDIADNSHGWTFNGDIAIKDGVIYGWGKCGECGDYEFFTYDLGTEAFVVHTPTYQASLQLAFGSDGELYGHRSGIPGDFFVINTDTGEVAASATSSPGILFTDCASGAICVPDTETAWAANVNFPGKNWATYFTYPLQGE